MNLPAIDGETFGEIKITIIEMPIPRNGDEGPTHDSLERFGIELRRESLHVRLKIA
jgi:hypothetical protein